jgi:hypothetical protein
VPFGSAELRDIGYRDSHTWERKSNSTGDVHKMLLSDFEIGKNSPHLN